MHFIKRMLVALLCAAICALSPLACAAGVYGDIPAAQPYTALTDAQKAQIPLINAAHPLPDDFSLPSIDGRAPSGIEAYDGFSPLVNLFAQRHSFRLASSEIWMCAHVYEAMQRLFAQAEAENMNGFIITSGYRSRARQAEIYAEKPDGIAAKPGCSEHETGLSFDVTAYSDNGDFSTTPQYKWLIRHCWEFGFILRYPEGTSDITGISGESWHFRYVGVDAALDILAQGITLEEYLEGVELRTIDSARVKAGALEALNNARSVAATLQPANGTPLPPTPEPTAAEPTPRPTLIPTVSPTDVPAPAYIESHGARYVDTAGAPGAGNEVIYLCGGSFWWLEKLMQQLDGVLDARCGYANGDVPYPTYAQVMSGLTGCAECVRVEFDPVQLSVDDLLDAYFTALRYANSPVSIDKFGTQYRYAVYSADMRALAAADEIQRADVETAFITSFYEAEEYLQDYLIKDPAAYSAVPPERLDAISARINAR